MSGFDALDYGGARKTELPPEEAGEDLRWAVERQFRDLEDFLDCYICIHDVSGVFRRLDGESIFLSSRTIHQAPICRLLHTNACIQHCSRVQNERARKEVVPYVHHCWKGAAELIVPLIHEGTHVATLFAGASRGDKKIDKALPKKIIKTHAALPVWGEEKIAVMKRMLLAFANHLMYQLETMHSVRGVDDRQVFIQRWIHMHAHEKVGLGDLAEALALSPSRCSHVVQECFGQCFRYLLHHERLERARRMLLNSRGLAISEIANRAGFEDERHFSRSFKKKFNDAPGRYRRRYQVG